PGRLKVAVTTKSWSGATVDDEVAAATVRAGRMLEEMGHSVADAGPVVDWDAVMRSSVASLVGIIAHVLMARRPDPAKLEAVSRQVVRTADDMSALDLIAAFNAQNHVSRSVGAFFTEYDLLVTPTIGRLPAPHGTLRFDDPAHTPTSWLESIFDYGPFTMVF